MSEAQLVLPDIGSAGTGIITGVLLSSFLAMGYGIYLAIKVLKTPVKSVEMLKVAKAIEEGAKAYLARQLRALTGFVIATAIGLYFLYRHVYIGMPELSHIPIGIAMAFLLGVTASYGAGYVGMLLAVKGNVRSAWAALTSAKQAMEVAFSAGAVSGMFTVGFGLLGAALIFLIYRENAVKVLIGFGFGGSLAALFMRVGGGIYTKAADVGGDLVGKIEAGIPEDDPRNAATIADNVGDNVGDCAGMASDVFESYEVTLVAAIILAAGTLLDPKFTEIYGAVAAVFAAKLALFPLLLRAVGVFSSILGIWSVKVKDEAQFMRNPMQPISRGYWISALASVVGFAVVNGIYLRHPGTGAIDWRFFLATTSGIILALLTLFITNYFTHPDKAPVTEIADSTKTGPATMILSGMAHGMESTTWAVVVICGTIVFSVLLFPESASLAAYGVALSGLGLLTTTGFILAMDTYGPITDNAHGIFEMSGLSNNQASKTLSWMDAIGNTTKALTKGLAIATAVIAAISLFRSFIDETNLGLTGIQINLPSVFVGLLLGAAVPFLFSAFALRSVARAAYAVVEEVRRQFREHPGIMAGKELPDYARCVTIVTTAAQKELLGPGILAIFTPLAVGFALGVGALGGFLGGAIVSGQLLAVFMANTGAAWDNAKKKIEDGYLGGKGTESHKAAVVGDTVGDPFKDTAGPSLNPLIKVMNLVGILAAPFIIRDIAAGTRILIVGICLAFLSLAVYLSKRRA